MQSSPIAPLLDAGSVVGGKYELIRWLGRGSMGEVWVAHHRPLGEFVALKVLSPEPGGGNCEDPTTAASRFRFEARIAARLSRKTRHIVRVTDYGEDDGLPYLVMELLEGQALDQRLLLRGSLPPTDVAHIVAQIGRALEEAHAEGVVHRDLKPANVFLASDEDKGLLVKLLDFGIARASRTLSTVPILATAKGLIFGTPGYMSPEQASGSNVDFRCDLWALATLAYEALTGELPIPGEDALELFQNLRAHRFVPVHERDSRLPQALGPFFERAFATSIEQRFASAPELTRAFEMAAKSDVSSVGAPSRPRRAWGIVVTAGAVVAVAGLLVVAAASRTPTHSTSAARTPLLPVAVEPPAEPVVLLPPPPAAPAPPSEDPPPSSATSRPAEPGANSRAPSPARGTDMNTRRPARAAAPPAAIAPPPRASPQSSPTGAPAPRASADRSAVL